MLSTRLEELLQQKAFIDAQVAQIMSSSSPTASNPHHGRYNHPQEVPRSHSYSGQSMSRTISSGRGHYEAVQMSPSVSHCSVSAMSRTVSRSGSLPGSSVSYAKSSRVQPQLQTTDNQREASVMENWATSHDDPYTVQSRRQLSRSLSQRKPDLEQVVEIDTEIDSGVLPNEYFARMPVFSVTPSPIDIIPTGGQWRRHRGSASSLRRPSFGLTAPTTPSSASLTNGTTCDMSRQSSFNDALVDSIEMMNVNSNTSIFSESNSNDERSYPSSIFLPASSYSKPFPSNEERSLLLAGAGGASENPQYSLAFQDHAQAAQPPSQSVENMKRSPSNESTSSSTSASSRAATMLKRQNQLAARLLAPAPKAVSDEVAMSREGSQAMVSLKSKDGSENRAVAAITKAPYQRPKHERVYCSLCTDNPDGFRGAHELGRHHDRQHKKQVKKFVCMEPTDGVINPQFRPVNPVSKCKSCSGQKRYGAYYNAAAHLRRAHFKPKTRGRVKSTKAEEKSEKRGGKGGGDWPPMSELKRWMKDVQENSSESQQQSNDDEDEDEEFDDDDCVGSYENDDDEDAKLQDASNNIPSSGSNFDAAYSYTDTTMVDAYPIPSSNYNPQSMQNVQYDELPLPQSIEHPSMHTDSSQSSFAEYHFTSMNVPVAFIENFHPNFDDHLFGQDSFSTFPY